VSSHSRYLHKQKVLPMPSCQSLQSHSSPDFSKHLINSFRSISRPVNVKKSLVSDFPCKEKNNEREINSCKGRQKRSQSNLVWCELQFLSQVAHDCPRVQRKALLQVLDGKEEGRDKSQHRRIHLEVENVVSNNLSNGVFSHAEEFLARN
jgi:hypothetical protein